MSMLAWEPTMPQGEILTSKYVHELHTDTGQHPHAVVYNVHVAATFFFFFLLLFSLSLFFFLREGHILLKQSRCQCHTVSRCIKLVTLVLFPSCIEY